MRKVLIVARQEFRTMIRHRFYRIITVLIPLLGFLAIGGFMVFQAVTADKPPESEKVGYVDHSGIVTGFGEQGNITFLPFLSEDEARQE
jgi:ABC-type Na+ efflux pump permease subunit